MLEAIARFSRRARASLLYIAATGLVLMTAIIGWQVFGRFVLQSSPSWSEQASLVLMIWYVFFAAAAGVSEGFHIRITAAQDMAPAALRRVMQIAAQGLVAACGLGLLIWGGELVAETWSHTIPTLGLPRGFAYLPLPISGVLITLFALEALIETAAGADSEAASGADKE